MKSVAIENTLLRHYPANAVSARRRASRTVKATGRERACGRRSSASTQSDDSRPRVLVYNDTEVLNGSGPVNRAFIVPYLR